MATASFNFRCSQNSNAVDEITTNVFHDPAAGSSPMLNQMKPTLFALCLGGLLALCGCEKQAKLNSQKIDLLTDKLAQQEQQQSKQLAVLQTQLAMLAPQLDKETSAYFEKNRDYALFFHTNTLFLLLTIGKQIEAQLTAADAARAEQNEHAYHYHTNQLSTAYLCAAQIEEELTALTKKLEEKITAETRQTAAGLSNALANRITSATAPDATEIAWRKQIEAQTAQIQRELQAIRALLAATNPPAAP